MINPSQLFKCLADETRLLATLLIYKEGELCVCELMEAMDDSQPKVSRHLAQLRACGLLTDRRQGQWVYYSLNSDLPEWAVGALDAACVGYRKPLDIALKTLSTSKERPNRC
ncbi:metalloregulator ArsR/SmtB family transcription factor [Arenicella xantha]|uniref:ArsR family transcriptional regulator n=1 Tax=Arenicella xantha TaxID=644221 RepID=A0A395JR04_9GAMM|nr:metalloregulator ArsR/SmtB family transcription factor [Arenicella xantha]RBP51150.1 ArsR family transcriptional regulator [Arenicella xantha]